MTRTLTILVDQREKQPLLLPGTVRLAWRPYMADATSSLFIVTQKKATLKTGDYQLEDHPSGCIIERKGSLSEICGNLFEPVRRTRFIDELKRLRDTCRLPVLLFEGDPHDLSTQSNRQNIPHTIALHSLIHLLADFRVWPLFVRTQSIPHRRATGELATILLFKGAQPLPPLEEGSPTSAQNGV